MLHRTARTVACVVVIGVMGWLLCTDSVIMTEMMRRDNDYLTPWRSLCSGLLKGVTLGMLLTAVARRTQLCNPLVILLLGFLVCQYAIRYGWSHSRDAIVTYLLTQHTIIIMAAAGYPTLLLDRPRWQKGPLWPLPPNKLN